jgi:hypothetical protein
VILGVVHQHVATRFICRKANRHAIKFLCGEVGHREVIHNVTWSESWDECGYNLAMLGVALD